MFSLHGEYLLTTRPFINSAVTDKRCGRISYDNAACRVEDLRLSVCLISSNNPTVFVVLWASEQKFHISVRPRHVHSTGNTELRHTYSTAKKGLQTGHWRIDGQSSPFHTLVLMSQCPRQFVSDVSGKYITVREKNNLQVIFMATNFFWIWFYYPHHLHSNASL